MKLAEITNSPEAEKRGADRIVQSFFAEKDRRDRDREDETRREDHTVEILLGEMRAVLVCAHTEVQFTLFRRKLVDACEEMRIPEKKIRRVMRGDELQGIGPERYRLVLLDSWELFANDDLTRMVRFAVNARGFAPLTT